MTQNSSSRPNAPISIPVRIREALSPVFRQRRAAAAIFCSLISASALGVALRPNVYEAQMKFLVNRERVDPVLSPAADSAAPRNSEVSDTELNSEVELLRSRDLLERVVLESNLHRARRQPAWSTLLVTVRADDTGRGIPPGLALPLAIKDLDRSLSVQRIKMTNLIRVTYRSRDPRLAAAVLSKMGALYLEKHLAVHRPHGTFAFFQEQTNRIQRELDAAQSSLMDFTRQADVVSARQEKESALNRRGEFEAQYQVEQAAIVQARQRLVSIEAQLRTSAPRVTTAVRVSNTSAHLAALQGTLVGLELKQIELLGKFDPNYHPVQEVGKQIAQTRAAIQEAQRWTDREETSDRNLTYEWLQSERAKTRAELSSLEARASAVARSASTYAARARLLEERQAHQEDLARRLKTAEENLLLYTRKQEEARISDALDRERILNVAISEDPAVPLLPAGLPWYFLLAFALLVSAALSVATAILMDRMDPTLHSPEQVLASLDVPILAAIPKGAF